VSAEPILDSGQAIIDAHHHLRDRDDELYLDAQYLADLATGHRVVASVAVETGVRYRSGGPDALRPAGETAFLAGIAERSERSGGPRVAAAIVAYADLRLGEEVDAVLDAHEVAGAGHFRGVRMSTPWHEDPRLRYPRAHIERGALRDPRFRRGFSRLASRGLSFDVWVYHTQLDDVTDLACAFPQTTIVLDHAGGPLGIGPYDGHREEVFGQWRQSLRALSACPNMVVKLGGFGMPIMGFGFARETSTSPALANAWRPYVDAVIDAFGAARCMFESNFPPDRQSAEYAVVWNTFKRIAGNWSPSERAMLFHGTAARVYRIESR